MDITFQKENYTFNFRVCGIIIHNQKILAMKDERSSYFYLPGGRVQMQETCEEAILREMQEELQEDIGIERCLWVNQGFFMEDVSQQQYHELCFYYLMDISNTKLLEYGDSFVRYEGNRKHVFTWLSFDDLKDCYFYPIFLKSAIFDLPETIQIIENRE